MMKLARVSHGSEERIGVVEGTRLRLLPAAQTSLVDLIEAGKSALSEIEAMVADGTGQLVELADVRLLAPMDRFQRDVLCTGWNYYDHFTEGIGKRQGQEVERPKAPTFFTKSPETVIGPRDDINHDTRISKAWDYEAEIAVIIGKEGRSIPTSRAMDHVWGYCLANDVSQRDLQRRHGGQWLKGKSIDGTMPLGPWVSLARDIDLPDIRIQCLLNGRLMQDESASAMAFSVPELIAELSLGMTLRPGDVLLTGTPSGVGHAREPQVFLKAGDEVVVRAEALGELRNLVRSTDLYGQSNVNVAGAA